MGWPNTTILDLSGNPRIRFLDAGMVTNMPALQTIDLRGTGVEFVTPNLREELPSLRVLQADLPDVTNLALGSWAEGLHVDVVSFREVCCERADTGLQTADGEAIYACNLTETSGDCSGCVFEEGYVYSLAGPITTPISPSEERRCDATSSAERCGEECASTSGCTHFTWDARGLSGISSSQVECMCACACVHVHVRHGHVHVYMCASAAHRWSAGCSPPTLAHAHAHAHICTCTCPCRTCACTHALVHACTCARMHLCTHAPVHTCTCGMCAGGVQAARL